MFGLYMILVYSGFSAGGDALTKIAASGGSISCEKSRFYAKKSYFSNFRGCVRRVHPPWIRPCSVDRFHCIYKTCDLFTSIQGQ